jgi:hypothetical protein
MHGKDITLPKGAEVTAYVNGDVKMDLAKFQPAPATVPPAITAGNTPPSTTSNSAKLQVDSAPTGADIEIDGTFAGNTPSEVQVTDGDHTITVKKLGFKDWERKMKVSSGSNIRLNAALEKTDP